MSKIFDVHTHIYPDAIAERAVVALNHFYDFVSDGKGTYSDLTESSKENGVCGFLLLCVATNAHQIHRVNESIIDAVKRGRRDGFEAYAFGGMHPCDNMEEEVGFCVDNGLSGIKIHPDIQGVDIDDKRLYPLYDMANGRFPIYFHSGDDRPQYRFSSPAKLAKILKEFPKLVVVAAHLGGYMANDEAIEYLRGNDRVWYDTSSALWAMTTGRADEIIGQLGTERLMFGTDYPVKYADSELDRFYKLKLTDKEREDILYNNAQTFLHLQ